MMELTQAQLADLFGCTTRALRKWDGEGLSAARSKSKKKRGRYDGRAAIEWYVERAARKLVESGALVELPDEAGHPLNKLEWAGRYERARALTAEDELRLARGELVEDSRVRDVLARAAAVAKGLPRREAAAVGRMLGVEPRAAVPLLERVSDAILGHLRAAVEEVERA